MNQNSIVVFVCEHGAAKSVLAATYFNKLARDHNLNLRAIARGIYPDAELSPKAVAGLREDGLIPSESVPTKLDPKELESAEQIVSFCTLPEEYRQRARVEDWENVPAISEDYEKARDAIVAHLRELIAHI